MTELKSYRCVQFHSRGSDHEEIYTVLTTMGSLIVVHYIALLTVFVLLNKESETLNISGYSLKEIHGTCWLDSKCDNCKRSLSGVKVCCSECRNAGFIVSGLIGWHTCSCWGDPKDSPTFIYPNPTNPATSAACVSFKEFKGTWFTLAALIASSFAVLAVGRRN